MTLGDLSLPLQHVLHLGEMDRWLRGIAHIVPPRNPRRPASDDGLLRDFNRYVLKARAEIPVAAKDVQTLTGFRQLVAMASQKNVRLDIADHDGVLVVAFLPDQAFAHSVIFGANYTNILPALFGGQRTPQAG